MSETRRRRLLAIAAFLTLGSGIAAGLLVGVRRVHRAEGDLLRAETAIAAELARGPSPAARLEPLFDDRWAITPEVDVAVDRAEVAPSAAGPVGRAAVLDADGWQRVGTLTLHPPRDSQPERPTAALLIGLVALAAMVPLCIRWTRPQAPHFVAVGALLLLALPLAATGRWADHRLERATGARMQVATGALESVPDLGAVMARPGGVFQLTGVSFMLRDETGGIIFSSLPTAASEELAPVPAPAPERVEADHVRYAVADVGPVRLALLPYEHTHGPGAPLALIGLVALAAAACCAGLARLADHPRVLRRNLVAWGFLAPALLHLAVFTVGPLLFAAWLSLHRWSLIDVARPFVGLANYLRVLGDPAWWNAIANTAVFTLHVPFAMALALGIALIVHRRARGIVLLRALFFLPSITSLVAIAIAWQWMYHDEYGLINWALSLVGLGPVPWLSSTATALPALMLMAVWLVVGYQMVLFQAGLAAIPHELYDAARIDGAGPWRRFFHVTLPGLRHTLFFVLVTSVIGSFQIFGAVYVMTEGGPLHATDVAVFHIYEEAWEFFRFGNAAAMSWILFAIIFLVTWLHFRVLERRVEEAA